ncbi:MAG: NAD-dependent epimerase/dehydratase family protein [Candidatus Pacebacteria bacterium]|jgi:CDP-glucose 4,6-dehydratase|nr:NAD-dependent epimerase/dehydratase family protein [Candidatus Paceibacterota bacterium]MBT4004456.1 NAD-dependent epimerase/dehydratase family protein [Candidatus Paceibacterota bacterium]MBT4358568.1 NAD-dependent epimerase/dehydratase family protein [Candidatus Paceibacterota bacterium]MBT4680508.1 NAD-dependent epimerase/dehydratase family protein [Candidatus Paceibacterota bacterium]MBT6898831.1 NAD-dependent epimerase/dehydratase family protein [Candidatus Paceibacterota bacterium]
MNQAQYLKNKNVLITGMTGFIGSRLAMKLSRMGANVFGTSRTYEKNNIYRLDIQSFDEVNQLIKDKKIDICFHLAGEAIVEAGQKDPYGTFDSNISSTLNILESARQNKLKKVVISSTAHVYGDHTPPCSEIDIPQPSRPYETSKLCIDLIAQSYAKTYDLPIFIPRFVNIYGPGDKNLNRLIPATIRTVIMGKNPKMWGGGAIRDYLYIDDAVSALIHLASANSKASKNGIIFNFGADNRISVEELIGKIISTSEKELKIDKVPSSRKDEILRQYVSWKKAKETLEWSPKTNLDKGLKLTYNWYKKQQDK